MFALPAIELHDTSSCCCRYEVIKELEPLLNVKGAREGAFARAIDVYRGPLAECLPSGSNAVPPPAPIGLPPKPDDPTPDDDAFVHSVEQLSRIHTTGMQVLGEEGLSRPTDYLQTDVPAVRKLKSDMLCVESAIPEQAMADTAKWDRAKWIRAVQVRHHPT